MMNKEIEKIVKNALLGAGIVAIFKFGKFRGKQKTMRVYSRYFSRLVKGDPTILTFTDGSRYKLFADAATNNGLRDLVSTNYLGGNE